MGSMAKTFTEEIKLEARRLGFDSVVVEAGCRAIDMAGSLDAAWSAMAAAGVQRVRDLG